MKHEAVVVIGVGDAQMVPDPGEEGQSRGAIGLASEQNPRNLGRAEVGQEGLFYALVEEGGNLGSG